MQRSLIAYLWDMQAAATEIQKFTDGISFESYSANPLIALAVERDFEILGEAMNQASRLYPDSLQNLTELSRIVSFRNRLAHGYMEVDNLLVWGIVQGKLPALLVKLNQLIADTVAMERG